MTRRRGLARRAQIARTAFKVAAFGALAASIVLVPAPLGALGGSLALLMAAIALHDARHFTIPNALNAAALALALSHAAVLDPSMPLPGIALAALRGAITGGVFLAIRAGYEKWRGREGLGMGDVKLAAVAGVWLDGIGILIAVELAAVSAIAAYLLRYWLGGRAMRATNALPFGLYLAPAIWVAWLLDTIFWFN